MPVADWLKTISL